MIAGIAMTILSSKTEVAWNWKIYEWDDEIEYYGWIDRVGQLGIVYFLTGITWAIGEADLDQFLWAVWAAYLSGIAIQGFRDETETPWRRGFGSMGSIFSYSQALPRHSIVHLRNLDVPWCCCIRIRICLHQYLEKFLILPKISPR